MNLYLRLISLSLLLLSSQGSYAATPPLESGGLEAMERRTQRPSLQERLKARLQNNSSQSSALIFDFPVTNNEYVARWLTYFQKNENNWFGKFLSRSYKYLPLLQSELEKQNLPQDLAYMVLIESGFSSSAVSSARAVGPWQFMAPTARHYGLRMNSWLDERRDFLKSTRAATRYLLNLKREFKSWYLVVASYNMGEGALRRQIQKHKTNDYWQLVKLKAIPEETRHYVPKILAAMLIAKAPALYGFRDVVEMKPLEFDLVRVPGGTKLSQVADHLQVTHAYMKELNAELLNHEVPASVSFHHIKVPKGAASLVEQYVEKQNGSVAIN